METRASHILLRPGTLSPAILARTEEAIACRALHSITTRQAFLDEGGLRFVVRIAANLTRKAEDRRRP